MRFSSLIPPTLQGAHTITCFTINTTSRGPCTALLADVARVPSLYPAGFRLHEENPGVLGEPDFFCKRMLVFQARGQINVTVWKLVMKHTRKSCQQWVWLEHDADWSLLLIHPFLVMRNVEWFRRCTWPYEVKSPLAISWDPPKNPTDVWHAHKLSRTLKEFELRETSVKLGEMRVLSFWVPKMPQIWRWIKPPPPGEHEDGW